MPGTPDGALGNETVDERSVIVAAVRIDSENLGPFAHQQNLPVADMADQLAILEGAGIDTLCQVGSARFSLLLSHLPGPLVVARPCQNACDDKRHFSRIIATPAVRLHTATSTCASSIS